MTIALPILGAAAVAIAGVAFLLGSYVQYKCSCCRCVERRVADIVKGYPA